MCLKSYMLRVLLRSMRASELDFDMVPSFFWVLLPYYFCVNLETLYIQVSHKNHIVDDAVPSHGNLSTLFLSKSPQPQKKCRFHLSSSPALPSPEVSWGEHLC